jgi:ankyrin repeat protein
MFKELFSSLKQKNTLKIILTTQSENSTAQFIERIATKTLREGITTTDEQLTWSDLTASSQRKMLEKTVIFQGTRVALNQVTSVESVTDSFPLAELLREKELKIGKEPIPSDSSGYSEMYYIDRTINHNIVIRQDISNENQEGRFADLLASTEQEFKQLCQKNPKRNVHWLVKDKSGELIWQQSQGDLNTLRKYTDAQKSHSYAPSDLDKLLQLAKHKRVMIIAEKAGMGKSTVLTHLSKGIKQKFPVHWLVRIDLNNYTELLRAQKGKKLDKRRLFEFVSKEVLKLESHLEKELFRKSFEGNKTNKVVVMVDGFDEISPNYKETVLDILQVLKQTSLEQLWVATRPHLRDELEDNLQQLSYTLEPFSEDDQVEFLKKFWFQTSNPEDKDQPRLKIFAITLIKKLAQSISDKDKEFTGIPLQTRMLAEAFEQEFMSFYSSEKPQPELPRRLDLVGLYRSFIERKHDIYYKEKCKTPGGNLVAEEQRKRDFKSIQVEHQLLALEALFTEDQVTFVESYDRTTFSDEELARIGIAQRNHGGKPHFIHRTFAEYFVADFLVNQLTKKTKQHERVKELLLSEVLLKMDCHVIRAFLDGLLEKSQPSKEALKEYGEKLDEQWNERKIHGTLTGDTSALHQAAKEDIACVFGFLLDSLKSGEYSNTIKMMLFARDSLGQNVWYMAAVNGSVQALEKIWEWAEEVKSTLIYNPLLSQNRDNKTVWQLSAEGGDTEEVEKMRDRAHEEQINSGELKNELLLSQDFEGRTAWHAAATRASVKIMNKLWGWAKKELSDPDLLKKQLLLYRDMHGVNAGQRAARTGSVEILGKLWDWAKELQLEPEEVREVLLSSKQKPGPKAWHMAAEGGHVEVLEKLWGWAEEMQLKPEELRDELSSKDEFGQTAWHKAAGGGYVEVLEKLWDCAKQLRLEPEELRIELFSKDDFRQTAWQMAAKEGHVQVLAKMWDWAKELQLETEELLLSQDWCGRSVWETAAIRGHIETLEKLWDCAKSEKLPLDSLKSLLFLPEQKGGNDTWGQALLNGRIDMIRKLWGWAKELQLIPDELKNNLVPAIRQAAYAGRLWLLETLWDLCKETQLNPDELNTLLVADWHEAAAGGYLEILERLWLWAGEVQQTPHEFQSRLLLGQNMDGKNAWHMAAAGGHVEVLEKLWGWAKEKLNTDYLKSVMFLLKDSHGFSTWCYAICEVHTDVIQKLWGWAEELQLTADELKNKLFLAVDREGNSAVYQAACTGSKELLGTIWGLSKEAQLNPDELSKLLVADWHKAAARGNLDILERLWLLAGEVQQNTYELKRRLLLENGRAASRERV